MAGQTEWLLEWVLSGTTYRQAVAGGDVIHAGFTWVMRHPQLGVAQPPQGWSETDQISNRSVAMSLTTWWNARVVAGNASTGSLTIFEGRRDAGTGALTVNPTGWQGFVSNYQAIYGEGATIKLEVANRLAFDRLPDVASTYSASFQKRLSAGDTAFDRSGAAPAPVGGANTNGMPGNFDNQWDWREIDRRTFERYGSE
jgi:hypothetical protein